MTTNQTPSGVKLLEFPDELQSEILRRIPRKFDRERIGELISAYALACLEAHMLNFEKALADLDNEPIGQGSDANDVTYYDIFANKIRRILRGR